MGDTPVTQTVHLYAISLEPFHTLELNFLRRTQSRVESKSITEHIAAQKPKLKKTRGQSV